MLRLNRILCALVVCVCVGAAYGAVTKIKALSAVGYGVTECPGGDGMALFHFKTQTGETEVNIAITDFLPETTYGVRYENQFGTGAEFSQAITTNPAGNGHWHDFANTDVTSSPRVIIFVDDNNDFEYTPGEERACGGTNCNF